MSRGDLMYKIKNEMGTEYETVRTANERHKFFKKKVVTNWQLCIVTRSLLVGLALSAFIFTAYLCIYENNTFNLDPKLEYDRSDVILVIGAIGVWPDKLNI
jgi:hypothetical protein